MVWRLTCHIRIWKNKGVLVGLSHSRAGARRRARRAKKRPPFSIRVAHALVGKPEFEPTRDGVLEIASHHATQRSMVAALVTYVPIVGIVAVTVNIAIQVHGFRSLGLAIIQNLSLGSLALIVITSLLTYLLPAVAVSMSRITSDKSFSGPVRRGFRWAR
jgi:hypothetical protein